MIFFLRLMIFVTAVIFHTTSVAQTAGGNPPYIHWQQINIPEARIIFERGMDSAAQRAANIISLIHNDSLNQKRRRKINIVLQNTTLHSNGYVGLAPFRSEFFTAPPQNPFEIGSMPWIDLLTIHEFRHVMQYNHMDAGLSHVAKTLFGEGGEALAKTAAVPDWYFEGDAVFSETFWSHQGRGRIPAFFNGFKAIWQQNKNYRYMKIRNGSLKDYVPNHYPLGYMLVARGRELYGNDFWNKVSYDAAAYKNLFYPFQHAFKKHAGLSFTAFTEHTFDYFKEQFMIDTLFQKKKKQEFLNEQFPALLPNGDIIFVKSSYSTLPRFSIRTKDGDKKIRNMDASLSYHFNYNAGKIVYASYRSDLRWGNLAYNELSVVDVHNGKQSRITKKSRYFTPDIDSSGHRIIAVHYDSQNKTRLHLLNSNTGEVLKEFANPENFVYSHPRFTGSNTIISEARNVEGRMSIIQLNITTGEVSFLLPFTYRTIGFPVVKSDTLFFTCSFENEEILMAAPLAEGRIFRIKPTVSTELHTGNYALTANTGTIAWHGFTANGNKIITVSKDNLTYREVDASIFKLPLRPFNLESLIHRQKPEAPHNVYEVTKYPKMTALLNFHTLLPEISDPDYSLQLLSENILNTFHASVYGTYNRAEKFKRLGFSATYSGLFPLFTAGLQYTADRSATRGEQIVNFNQLEPFAGISIPFNLSRGRSFTNLRLSANYTFNKTNYTGHFKDSFPTFSYSYLNKSLSFTHQLQKAVQNIYPRFAQSVFLNYKSTVSHFNGHQLLLNSTFYFPGFFKNHSLAINSAYLKKDTLGQMNFSSSFPFSRGYQSVNFYRMIKAGGNYYFPVAYPDVGVGNILYLLRIRANVFYDFTRIMDFNNNGEKYVRNFNSTGSEIIFDTKWWNQVPVSFGIRYSHLLNRGIFLEGPHRWEIIMPVNIFKR